MCTEQVELAQSHLTVVYANLNALQERYMNVIQRIVDLEETLYLTQEEECQLKEDIKAKSLELTTIEKEVDVKSKNLADLEAVPILSPHDVSELERHEQIM